MLRNFELASVSTRCLSRETSSNFLQRDLLRIQEKWDWVGCTDMSIHLNEGQMIHP